MKGDAVDQVRVLLVEDNPADARLIMEALRDAPIGEFELHTAEWLRDGLRELSKGTVDVALIDLTLPDSRGLDTLRVVRGRDADLPIVVLTGLEDEALGVEALKEGAQDYLVKGQVDARALARALIHAKERVVILSELERANRELRELSLTDELTGLSNRRGFTHLADQLMKQTARTGDRVLLLLADVDGLKRINDRLGHQEGDATLVGAARVLAGSFRGADVKARIGGDEFAVLAQLTGDRGVGPVLDRLAETLEEWNRSSRRSYLLSLSVGTCVVEPRSGAALDEMMARADADLYRRKRERAASYGREGAFRDAIRG
jgi:diguanylate cyclase (GGDEF)-like protein